MHGFHNDKYLTALENSRILHIYQVIQAENLVLSLHLLL